MTITIIYGYGTVQADLDPATIKPYGVCGECAKATYRGDVLDVAKLHKDGKWWARATRASRTLKGRRDMNGDEPVSWVQS